MSTLRTFETDPSPIPPAPIPSPEAPVNRTTLLHSRSPGPMFTPVPALVSTRSSSVDPPVLLIAPAPPPVCVTAKCLTTALEALNAAQRQAALGRYREACHFVLLSALLAVDERGDSRFDRSATNREVAIS